MTVLDLEAGCLQSVDGAGYSRKIVDDGGAMVVTRTPRDLNVFGSATNALRWRPRSWWGFSNAVWGQLFDYAAMISGIAITS